MVCAGENSLILYGPLPSGISSVVSSMLRLRPSLSEPSHQCFGMTVSCPMMMRKFVTSRSVEDEGHIVVAGFFRLHDMAIIGGGLRADFLVRVEGKNHVIRCDGLAVLPFRFGTKSKGHRRQILREAHGFGEQPVDAGHFVERRCEKGIEDKVDALNERAFHAGNHRIEIVERAERDL